MPTILDWRRSGKIGQRGYSSLAQSVEHLTVNQVVAGASPAGGAKKEHTQSGVFFFVFLVGFDLPQTLSAFNCSPTERAKEVDGPRKTIR